MIEKHDLSSLLHHCRENERLRAVALAEQQEKLADLSVPDRAQDASPETLEQREACRLSLLKSAQQRVHNIQNQLARWHRWRVALQELIEGKS